MGKSCLQPHAVFSDSTTCLTFCMSQPGFPGQYVQYTGKKLLTCSINTSLLLTQDLGTHYILYSHEEAGGSRFCGS